LEEIVAERGAPDSSKRRKPRMPIGPLRQKDNRACIKKGKSQVACGLQHFLAETAERWPNHSGEVEGSGSDHYACSIHKQSPPSRFSKEGEMVLKILKEPAPPGIKSEEKKAEDLQHCDGPGKIPGNRACTLKGDLFIGAVREYA